MHLFVFILLAGCFWCIITVLVALTLVDSDPAVGVLVMVEAVVSAALPVMGLAIDAVATVAVVCGYTY